MSATLAGPATDRVCPARRESSRPRITLAIMSSTTEITLLGGGRHRVEGMIKEVERLIVDAARGSIMEFAWFTDAQTGEPLGVNPECVATLRAVSSVD